MYFDTLNQNDGEIRGTSFAPNANRRENGLLFSEIEGKDPIRSVWAL